MTEIRIIEAVHTLKIRHKVMWPNKPLEYVKLPDDDSAKHFGLFIDNKIISVVSLFEKNGEVQFRKFATLGAFQGKGYGSILLKHVFNYSKINGFTKIWCNARVGKTAFYLKFGLKETNETFVKGGLNYVIMEKTF